MGEAIFGFIGTIIGGLLAFLGTYLSLKHNSKLELRKLSLSHLIEKKVLIEQLIESCLFDITGDMEQDQYNIINEFETIAKFLRLKPHYFLDSDEFHNSLYKMVCIENDRERSPLEILYEKREFNNSFNRFIRNELENTVRNINKLIELK